MTLLQAILFPCLVLAINAVSANTSSCLHGNPCWPTTDMLRELSNNLTGSVLLSGDREWSAAIALKNKRLSIQPGAVALCTTADDVVSALTFAHHHGLALSVKSTGHCYSGNCMAPQSFHIDVSRLNFTDVDPINMVMSVGPGSNFDKMYTAADDAGVLVVGGMCPTVGPVGFGLGGGHGPLIRSLGLGADNILSVDMVTTAGHRVLVSASAYPDLFWALRGGGGGAFGVVVGMTVRLHPAPRQMVSLSCAWPLVDKGVRVGVPILETWTRDLMPSLPNEWTFFTAAMRSPLGPKAPGFNWLTMNGVLALEGLYNGEWNDEAGSNMLHPSIEAVLRMGTQNGSLHCALANHTSFRAWHAQAWFADEGPISFRTYMASSFAQPGFDSTHHAKLVVDKVTQLPIDAINMMFAVQLGGKVSSLGGGDGSDGGVRGSTSVSKAFRTAVMMQENDSDWNLPRADEHQIDWATTTGNAFAALKGFEGAYLNEPDPSLPRGEYEDRFWGDNFGELQRVKRKWDAAGLFNCNQSVYN